ncbi:metallophosphoesterase [Candidatus Pacearchaeota archaeon]|nr:metallophosphoesterase [Candidatus Pacearchaeota archaeon]
MTKDGLEKSKSEISISSPGKNHPKKTKILAVGDLHGDERIVKKLVKQAEDEKVDLVILAGDITFAERPIKNIIGPFVNAGKKVLLIPGNHESVATIDFFAEVYQNTQSIHGYSFIHKNIGVFGAGGADIGIHKMSDSEIYNLLKKGNENIKNLEKKIMVTHMHPRGTKSELSGFKGSEAVRKAIEKFQPDVAIFAHIHETAGTEDLIGKTRAINVSRKGVVFEV